MSLTVTIDEDDVDWGRRRWLRSSHREDLMVLLVRPRDAVIRGGELRIGLHSERKRGRGREGDPPSPVFVPWLVQFFEFLGYITIALI